MFMPRSHLPRRPCGTANSNNFEFVETENLSFEVMTHGRLIGRRGGRSFLTNTKAVRQTQGSRKVAEGDQTATVRPD